MFSLRKRAKLLEQTANIQISNTTSDFLYSNQLPIELHYLIFDHLPVKHLAKLRTLNSSFKNLIDNTSYLWKRVALKLELNSNTEIEPFLEFLYTRIELNSIKLNCPIVISKSLAKKTQTLQNKSTKTFSLSIKQLNLLSICILNLFSDQCKSLAINSFVNSFGQVKSSKHAEFSSLNLAKLTKLECLDLACLYFDVVNKKYFIWSNVYSENPLLSRSAFLLEGIKELRIRYYFDSMKSLIKSVKSLKNLKILELFCSSPTDDYLNELSEEDLDKKVGKLKAKNNQQIETLLLSSSSILGSFFMLVNFAHPDHLKNLEIFLKSFNLNPAEVSREFTLMEKLVFYVGGLKRVAFFSTNMFQFGYQFKPSSLNYSFLARLSLDELNLVRFKSRSLKSSVDDLNMGNMEYKYELREASELILNGLGMKLRKLKLDLSVEDCEGFDSRLNSILKRLLKSRDELIGFYELDFRCTGVNCKYLRCKFSNKIFDFDLGGAKDWIRINFSSCS